MRIQEINSEARLLIGDAYDSNSLLLLHGKSGFLIDGLGSRKDAEDLKDSLENEAINIRFILCTHYFSDHLAALKLFPDAMIVAHKNYRHTFDSERHRTQEEISFYSEPTITLSNDISFRWGKSRLNVFHNPAHTMSTLNVDIPELDLIHVGDTLVGNIIYLSYSTPSLFYTALDVMERTGRTNLLSSHLTIRKTKAVRTARCYLQSLESKALQLWQNKMNETEFLKTDINECLPPTNPGTPFETMFHKRNLQSIVERKLFSV